MKNNSTTTTARHFTVGNTQTSHHYWVGELMSGYSSSAGQTFKLSRNAVLKQISIYSEMVIGEPKATLSLYEFDAASKTWKEKLSESNISLTADLGQQWIAFPLQSVFIEQNKEYAFKIECTNAGIIAIGECGWKDKDPYADGVQWTGNSENPDGIFHKHFDLSFAVTAEAA